MSHSSTQQTDRPTLMEVAARKSSVQKDLITDAIIILFNQDKAAGTSTNSIKFVTL